MTKVPFARSVYVKMAASVLLSWLGITLLGAVLFRVTVQHLAGEPQFKKIVAHCCELAAADIESANIEDKVDWYAEKLNIGVTVYDGTRVHASDADYPPLSLVRDKMSYHGDRHVYLRRRMNFVLEKGGRVYLFYHDRSGTFGRYFLLAVSASAALVLTVLLFHFRRMLRPLRLLHRGMARIADGELEYRMPVTTKDEFGALATAFNGMTGSLLRMMRAKERMILDVSHEFKSPLARIMLALEMDDIEKLRLSVAADAMSLSEMIGTLLERYRSGANITLELCHTDIGALVKDVIAREKNSARIRYVRRPCTVNCDPARTAILFRNIIENALFYSNDNIDVCIDIMDQQISLHKDVHKWAVFTVRDYGGGISAADLPYVFEPFYRADRSRSASTGGTGLGLFICKSIADAHGWKIEIESREGEGTCVRLRIPVDSCIE